MSGGGLIGLVGIGMAFVPRVRAEVKRRANNRSELSGSNEEPLEVAHLNHARDEDYQDPGNALLVTTTEHLAHHLIHRNRAEAIGLTEEGNEWAIGKLFERVFNFHRQRGIPDIHIQQRIGLAIQRWEDRDPE